uniref:Uncharacterized protein n=1 Tax=Physcomitrium patens TaxID=3218 RepID=A0A2K1KWQ0_PHYPA|nr:hypothetical protein PHYPA_005209 [Physcomitrium patens]
MLAGDVHHDKPRIKSQATLKG